MYISHFVYLFICQWTLSCFNLFGCYKIVLLGTCVQMYLTDSVFNVLGTYLELKLLNHMIILVLIF